MQQGLVGDLWNWDMEEVSVESVVRRSIILFQTGIAERIVNASGSLKKCTVFKKQKITTSQQFVTTPVRLNVV
jgi:hypothetical protein